LVAVPLVLLVAMGVMTRRAAHDLLETQTTVREIIRLKHRASTLLGAMIDNEAGQRGFLLSRNPQFLEPYDRSLQVMPRLREELRKSLVDPVSKTLLQEFLKASDARLAFSAETVDLQRIGEHDAAVAMVQSGRGKTLTDKVRRDAAALSARYDQLIHDAEERYATGIRWNEYISWGMVVLDAIFAGILVLLLLRLRRAESVLHVCAWSKTVQFGNEWISFEEYLTRKFGLSITHGIRPEEMEKMLQGISPETIAKTREKAGAA
jgi:methyl-accepting chemotaxis protein WspA